MASMVVEPQKRTFLIPDFMKHSRKIRENRLIITILFYSETDKNIEKLSVAHLNEVLIRI